MEQAELTLRYRELDRDCALLSYRMHGPNEFEPKLFIPDEEAVAGVREAWRELGRRVEELADPDPVYRLVKRHLSDFLDALDYDIQCTAQDPLQGYTGFPYPFQNVVHADTFPVDGLRPRGAGPHAGVAARAHGTVKTDEAVDHAHRARGTGPGAAATDLGAQAARRVVSPFGLAALRLGVAAPRAMQRTAFQKDQRPDAFAVVDAEFLDIEYDARLMLVEHGGSSSKEKNGGKGPSGKAAFPLPIPARPGSPVAPARFRASFPSVRDRGGVPKPRITRKIPARPDAEAYSGGGGKTPGAERGGRGKTPESV